MLKPTLVLALLLASVVPARAEDDPRQIFETGMKHFRAREYKEATVAFERFLELKPEPDMVVALQREAGLKAFQEMLLQQGLKEIAVRILKAAEARRKAVAADPALIASLVAEVEQVREIDDARNFETYLDAKSRLVRIGAPAAPELIARLVDENHDKVRARVQVTLVEMGPEAVLPLLASLADERKLMRQNACVLLGQIGDRRATAALKARLEDARELAEVKSQAEQALRKITGAGFDALPGAATCFHTLALGYHGQDPQMVRSTQNAERTVWYFDREAKRVAGRPVPTYAFADYLAEQACYEALRLDPDYAPVLPTLIRVTFSQMGEVEALLSVATQRMVSGEGDAAEVEALKARRSDLAKGLALALSTGRGPLYAALDAALAQGEVQVAVACCDALRDVEDGSWLPKTERERAVSQAWARGRYFPDAR